MEEPQKLNKEKNQIQADKQSNHSDLKSQLSLQWFKNAICNFEIEVMEKSDKELKNRKDFFDRFNRLTENRFMDQTKMIKNKVEQFKIVLDGFVNDISSQNELLKQEFIQNSSEVQVKMNSERTELIVNQTSQFKELLNNYDERFKSINAFISNA